MASSALQAPPAAWRIEVPSAMYSAVLILATTYNGILSIINAHGFSITYGMVSLVEMALLGGGLLMVMATGIRRTDAPPLLLFGFFILIALLMSIGNDYPYVNMIRNVGIIAIFTMMGERIPTRTLVAGAMVLSVVILAILCVEIFDQELYVTIFEPAMYLESSRGLQQAANNDTGLFANALGFEGRFSFGIFSTPRTSSIFIEQVSLAGYAAVVTILLLAQWKELPRWHRVVHIVVVLLILVSNNSRTSSALFATAVVGYFIYPRIPRYLNLLLAPMLLIVAAVIVKVKDVKPGTDDLPGRLATTIRGLAELDVWTLLTGNLRLTFISADSGYVFIIAASTLFGMIAYWAYVCFIVPAGTASQRRTLWGINTYLFCWLLIGGTSTFTIKTAALLWLIVGWSRAAGGRDGDDLSPQLG